MILNKPIISQDIVLEALKQVKDPELNRDLVSLNMIKDVSINGNAVSFTIVLTTPACPLKEKIKNDASKAVMNIPGVEKVDINIEANVKGDGQSRSLLEIPVRYVVAVASGKGGVGKTTVAVNIAISLARSGAKVGLLDADIYGPNIPTMMGLKGNPKVNKDKLIPPIAYGVKVMSIGFLVPADQPLIWRGPLLHQAIQQLLRDVEWGSLDYLIVDLPPGTGDVQLSLAQSVCLSGGVIVTLPQNISLEDASRGLQMFQKLDVPLLGVIENMSYLELEDGKLIEIFGSGGGEKLSMEAKVPFLGSIPIDPEIRIGGDNGKPIIVSHPDSKAAKSIDHIASTIAAQLSVLSYQNEGK